MQVWAWERVIPLQSLTRLARGNQHVPDIPQTALACKWTHRRVHQNEAQNVVGVIRDVLDSLMEGQVNRGYQQLAGRHEALVARGHERQHRLARTIEENPNISDEGRSIAQQFDVISVECMTVAFLGTRLSFNPEYAPPEETEQPPKVSTRCRRRYFIPTDDARCGEGETSQRLGRRRADQSLVY
ncbi:hypothetical protein HAX54_033438 [Datura stramonium]|uniref:Uncharacterized protein n=1 Tax=Datura stramonium TaxID=4076 RepID=A0ABS8VDF7_DATST|nr:hypothetical protein [Datura stramonium]